MRARAWPPLRPASRCRRSPRGRCLSAEAAARAGSTSGTRSAARREIRERDLPGELVPRTSSPRRVPGRTRAERGVEVVREEVAVHPVDRAGQGGVVPAGAQQLADEAPEGGTNSPDDEAVAPAVRREQVRRFQNPPERNRPELDDVRAPARTVARGAGPVQAPRARLDLGELMRERMSPGADASPVARICPFGDRRTPPQHRTAGELRHRVERASDARSALPGRATMAQQGGKRNRGRRGRGDLDGREGLPSGPLARAGDDTRDRIVAAVGAVSVMDVHRTSVPRAPEPLYAIRRAIWSPMSCSLRLRIGRL